ncbi:catalase [Virgibacillus halotolerans]|nr:catalase [Virgibacillus halotolerans]
MRNQDKKDGKGKDEQLNQFRVDDKDKKMTTNQGLKVSEDEFSLKAGERGPTLMEDFNFREKITHFDHERIPERVVHARGYGAHGEFELYESMKDYTKAGFLQEPGSKTPVFVRFSTVAGSKGSGE